MQPIYHPSVYCGPCLRPHMVCHAPRRVQSSSLLACVACAVFDIHCVCCNADVYVGVLRTCDTPRVEYRKILYP